MSRPDGWISLVRADPVAHQEREAKFALKRALSAIAGLSLFKKIPRSPESVKSGIGAYTAMTPPQQTKYLSRQREEQLERAKKHFTKNHKLLAAKMKAGQQQRAAFDQHLIETRTETYQERVRQQMAVEHAAIARREVEAIQREREIRAAVAAAPERRPRR